MGLLKFYRDKVANWFVNRCINKNVNHVFVSRSDISRVHILYVINQLDTADAMHQYSDLYEIMDWCSKQKIKTYVTLFIDNSINETKRHNIMTFDKKQCSKITLKPNKQILEDFKLEDCDVLLNLCSVTCFPLEYLAAVSAAKFKIGIKRDIQGAEYDFMIESKIEHKFPRDIFDSVMFYLGKIQSA